MTVVYLLIGFALGCLLTAFVIKLNSAKGGNTDDGKPKYLRRGILKRTFTLTLNKEQFDVQFEVGEIEKTSTKSKIHVIDSVASLSDQNTPDNKRSSKAMMENKWIESSDIEWIEDNVAEKRNEKIDELLKSK